jgi:hypothetical protein
MYRKGVDQKKGFDMLTVIGRLERNDKATNSQYTFIPQSTRDITFDLDTNWRMFSVDNGASVERQMKLLLGGRVSP